MTNFDMPNNVSSMKYTLRSVPGLADVGVPHGVGDGHNSGYSLISGKAGISR